MPSQFLLTTLARRSGRQLLLGSSRRRVLSSAVSSSEHESESFLSGTSSIYAEHMWERYQSDPNSVEES